MSSKCLGGEIGKHAVLRMRFLCELGVQVPSRVVFFYRVEQVVARQAHILEVVGSSPTPVSVSLVKLVNTTDLKSIPHWGYRFDSDRRYKIFLYICYVFFFIIQKFFLYNFIYEFGPGSEWTLVICLIHASWTF